MVIDRKDYPELNLILWDTKQQVFTEKEAFNKYDRRWRYVDHGRLAQQERELINHLKKLYGDFLT